MNPRILSLAKQQALSSSGVGANRNYKVGAVLFDKKGNVLEARSNSYKTHPKLTEFTAFPHLHAESSCLIHHGLNHCTGLHLFVARVRKPNDQLTMAKPCPVCMNLIRYSGIEKVSYTNWNGLVETLRI